MNKKQGGDQITQFSLEKILNSLNKPSSKQKLFKK